MIELFAARRRPLQQLDRAVDGDAFFVTSDQERNRALRELVLGDVVEGRRDEAADAALHVDGAATVELAVGNVAGEWRVRPFRFIALWHDVGVPRKHEMGR